MAGTKKCFIITPIGEANDKIRRHIDGIIHAAIEPALKGEFVICVAHEMPKIGSINKQVIEEIYSSDLVIANLTEKNPNVMYELAFRHCLGKPVIQIAEENTRLPFDIGTERTIMYRNDSQGVLDLRDAIAQYILELDISKERQGPIYDVLNSVNSEHKIFDQIDKSKQSDEDKDILKLILQKISDIEDKVEAIDLQNQKLFKSKNECGKETRILFTLSANTKEYAEELNQIADKLNYIYPQIKQINFTNRKLTIITEYFDDQTLMRIIEDTNKLLRELGIMTINRIIQ